MSDDPCAGWARNELEEGSAGGDTAQRLRHDLRQSLSTVMMLAAIVDRQPLDGPVIHGTLEQMLNEVDWMRQAVTGSAANDPRDLLVDVGDTVGEIWDCVAHAQRCAMRFVRESGVWTWADPVELRRAVRNLVENAVRAAGDGVVEVRVSTDGHQVMVEVHDSGPGFGLIPPQEQLGLITVRRFASAHEGRLVIDTSPLGGALVRLELPAMSPSYADDVFADVHADHMSYVAQRTTA